MQLRGRVLLRRVEPGEKCSPQSAQLRIRQAAQREKELRYEADFKGLSYGRTEKLSGR